jgi:methylglyoxal synthase
MAHRLRLALIAHDEKKDDMVAFAATHADFLESCDIVATGTTGGRVAEACPRLHVKRLKSGPLGGDQQIGALIAEGEVDALIFFVDPLTPMPHDVDVKALMRLAIVYNVPTALNRATAELILDRSGRSGTGRAKGTGENAERI